MALENHDQHHHCNASLVPDYPRVLAGVFGVCLLQVYNNITRTCDVLQDK